MIAGARPNFMKIAPLYKALNREPIFELYLVHTGQHYDREMSGAFFDELEIPKPDIDLEVGSATHAVQTANIMKRFEPVLLCEKPQLVMVVGDVNSTAACTLVAAKLQVPTAHVEAGLRSFDRRMPEEINRVVTDALSDYLFTTEPEAAKNLSREGIPGHKIFFVGNVMIDTLLCHWEKAKTSSILSDLGLGRWGAVRDYAVLTLHRPSNVDKSSALARIAEALGAVARKLPIIFPVHPRTAKQIQEFGLSNGFRFLTRGSPIDAAGLFCIPPLGYLDFLCLVSQSRLVLTDSGGIQEETTVLRIPCLTLRENTERPITVTCGSNTIVGSEPEKIIRESERILSGRRGKGSIPPKWDGKAAHRITAILKQVASGKLPQPED